MNVQRVRGTLVTCTDCHEEQAGIVMQFDKIYDPDIDIFLCPACIGILLSKIGEAFSVVTRPASLADKAIDRNTDQINAANGIPAWDAAKAMTAALPPAECPVCRRQYFGPAKAPMYCQCGHRF